ncbi:MAG TPA: class IV adenylate cyclase [Planctomycetes bacterium]|nr:class IV adenylate cyclase [Planctomycetota bacterium]
MSLEIEAKVKVESLKEIADRLAAIGGQLQYDLLQTDTYFDDADHALLAYDCGLRLRRQKGRAGEKVLLTYKGPRQKTRFKSRDEIEIEVSDFATAVELLTALGYQKTLEFDKRRQVWRFLESTVCLDELPLLGSFLEIEASSEQTVADTLRKMELADMPHISESYAHLIRARLNELSPDQMEAFFD